MSMMENCSATAKSISHISENNRKTPRNLNWFITFFSFLKIFYDDFKMGDFFWTTAITAFTRPAKGYNKYLSIILFSHLNISSPLLFHSNDHCENKDLSGTK